LPGRKNCSPTWEKYNEELVKAGRDAGWRRPPNRPRKAQSEIFRAARQDDGDDGPFTEAQGDGPLAFWLWAGEIEKTKRSNMA